MSQDLSVFDPLKSQIEQAVVPIKEMVVTNFQNAADAVEAAKQVKDLFKRLEKARTDLVGPLNAQVKSVNARAKEIEAPLLEAEAHIKRQLVKFETEQERLREIERKKVEAARIEQETALRAKQEEERAKLEEQAQAQADAAAIFGLEDTETAVADAAAELEQKHAEEQALAAAAVKQREFDIAQQGIKNTRKTWKCEVVDLALVPKQYLLVSLNEAAVLAMARAGVTDIPGVRLWQELSVAIGSKTYVPKSALVGIE